MHGNEAVGRQIVMFLAQVQTQLKKLKSQTIAITNCMILLDNAPQYMLVNYGKDDRVTRLVNTTDLWFMPSMNPDGFAAGRCSLIQRSLLFGKLILISGRVIVVTWHLEVLADQMHMERI